VVGGDCVGEVKGEEEGLTGGAEKSAGERESAAWANGRGEWVALGQERRGSAGARERGGKKRGPESAQPRGRSFLFFFFLNSFSPLYKYSFMFLRCQNEILYVK
jgi:hypothetical protein